MQVDESYTCLQVEKHYFGHLQGTFILNSSQSSLPISQTISQLHYTNHKSIYFQRKKHHKSISNSYTFM